MRPKWKPHYYHLPLAPDAPGLHPLALPGQSCGPHPLQQSEYMMRIKRNYLIPASSNISRSTEVSLVVPGWERLGRHGSY